MKNYRIYKITSPNTDKVYIGSTTQKYLCQRLSSHKRDHKYYLEGRGPRKGSFDIIDAGDAKIELLEQFNNITKQQLLDKESKYMNQYKNYITNIYNSGGDKAIKCECGGKYHYYARHHHFKTAKHMAYTQDK